MPTTPSFVVTNQKTFTDRPNLLPSLTLSLSIQSERTTVLEQLVVPALAQNVRQFKRQAVAAATATTRAPRNVFLDAITTSCSDSVLSATIALAARRAFLASVNRTSEEAGLTTFVEETEGDWEYFTDSADVTYNVSALPDRETWRNNGKAEVCYKLRKATTTYVICGEGKTANPFWDRKCKLSIHTMCVKAFVAEYDTRSCNDGGLAGSFGKFSCSSWGKKTSDSAVRYAGGTVTMKRVCAKSWVSAERELIPERYIINGGLLTTTKFQQEGFGRFEVLWAAAKCYGT